MATIRRGLALPIVGLYLGAGCTSIFDLSAYSVAKRASVSVPAVGDASDVADADSDEDQCASLATNFETACTNSTCVPFDNVARIAGFVADASLPPLPEGGADASAVDAQTTSATDATLPTDAGSRADASSDADVEDDGQASSTLPPCSSLPSPVFVIGSSGLASIVAELGTLASTVPITVVYTSAHSCDGAKSIILNETSAQTGASVASYWDASGTQYSCQIDPASEYADLGISNVFADQCLSLPQGAAGVGDFLGPVTPGALVVPTASTQTSISAEALYYLFGLSEPVDPWNDPNYLFINPSSGVQQDFGLAVGIPASLWHGTLISSSAQNISKIATSSQPEESLGNMSTDLVEAAQTSSSIKELAYQDYAQNCGYYPNSTATSADKQNVRDGHYPIWGFTHLFSKVNPEQVPINTNAATIVSYFTGNAQTPTGSFLKFVISDHLVPVCAMKVTRSTEMGPLSAFTPSPGCGCYFDALTTGNTACPTCTTSNDCLTTAPHCNLGYCEVN